MAYIICRSSLQRPDVSEQCTSLSLPSEARKLGSVWLPSRCVAQRTVPGLCRRSHRPPLRRVPACLPLCLQPVAAAPDACAGVQAFSQTLYGEFPGYKEPYFDVVLQTENVSYIQSPQVRAAARRHFDCPTLRGAALEDDLGRSSAGSHWESRLFRVRTSPAHCREKTKTNSEKTNKTPPAPVVSAHRWCASVAAAAYMLHLRALTFSMTYLTCHGQGGCGERTAVAVRPRTCMHALPLAFRV